MYKGNSEDLNSLLYTLSYNWTFGSVKILEKRAVVGNHSLYCSRLVQQIEEGMMQWYKGMLLESYIVNKTPVVGLQKQPNYLSRLTFSTSALTLLSGVFSASFVTWLPLFGTILYNSNRLVDRVLNAIARCWLRGWFPLSPMGTKE